MPKTPTGSKRPVGAIENAVFVMRLATGQVEEKPSKAPKRAAGGKVGGKKRAESLSAERRKQIAEKAAKSRWGK
jgi:hypothetical protein